MSFPVPSRFSRPPVALLLLTAAGLPLARSAEPPNADAVARRRYIVEGLSKCTRCHTPLNEKGERDRAQWLKGAPIYETPSYPAPNWALRAPRIAGTPPGTNEDFIRLMTTGIARTGKPPNPPMPDFRMTRADAEAVLAYLKSL